MPFDPSRLRPKLVARLYDRAKGADWDLPRERFAAALLASIQRAFPGVEPMSSELEQYIDALQLEDLALAAACAMGSEAAWDHFVAAYRPLLYRAADAIDPTGGARELADSLFAELFGLDERGGARRSLFRYFHGRSQLGTWLRAVLAQRNVDRLRTARRTDPLPDDAGTIPGPPAPDEPGHERAWFQSIVRRALASAIGKLEPRDRLRLGCYYGHGMTLAAIGRLLKEHEATVSRQLARARAAVRTSVEASLRTEHGMDDETVAEFLRSVVDDAGEMDLDELVRPAERKKVAAVRSRE
jgi:RNA polymerase sigma factor (sigma-70 family)